MGRPVRYSNPKHTYTSLKTGISLKFDINIRLE